MPAGERAGANPAAKEALEIAEVSAAPPYLYECQYKSSGDWRPGQCARSPRHRKPAAQRMQNSAPRPRWHPTKGAYQTAGFFKVGSGDPL